MGTDKKWSSEMRVARIKKEGRRTRLNCKSRALHLNFAPFMDNNTKTDTSHIDHDKRHKWLPKVINLTHTCVYILFHKYVLFRVFYALNIRGTCRNPVARFRDYEAITLLAPEVTAFSGCINTFRYVNNSALRSQFTHKSHCNNIHNILMFTC